MYVDDVLNRALKRNHTQPEFCQAVTEVLESIRPVVESNPYYEKTSLLERHGFPCLLDGRQQQGAGQPGLPCSVQ